MTVSLVGTIVSTTGIQGDFNNLNSGTNLSGDDDTVTSGGGMGDKISNQTDQIVSDNLSGGVSGVYDFSVGGADEGAHFIGWANTKTPIDQTTGITIYVGNVGGDIGRYDSLPANFYVNGFVTRVTGFTRDFDTAVTWTTNGNPAQLDDVDRIGFEFVCTTVIMGSFNNCQVDQFIIGFGVRIDVGTVGTPNTFEDVYAADEDTNFWGWWFRAATKGRLYIGPVTGTTASWFVDTAFSIKFANETVDVGFYGFQIRGANTTCTWTLANIFAEDPTVARWSLILDSAMGDTTGGFTDNSGTWIGVDVITLNANAALIGTTIINANVLNLIGATMDGCSVVDAQTADGVAFVLTSDLADISDSEFSFSDGHAIQIDTTGSYTFPGNTFDSYGGATGTNLEQGSTPAGFPGVLDVTETAFTGETTAHSVTMPTTVNRNDVLLAVIYTRADTVAANALVTVPTDWVMVQEDTSFANDISQHVLRKIAIGDEDATSVDFITDINATMVAQIYRIDEAFTDIEVGVAATGTSTSPDPPSLTPATGTQDYLWIEIVGAIDDVVLTGTSTSYGALDTLVSGASGNLRISASSATRDLNASVEDPDAATLASSVFWTANIISIQRSEGGSTDAAIFNDSGGLVTINVTGGGDTPSVRNGIGASTVVNNNVELTLTGMKDDTEIRVYLAGTTTEVAGIEDAVDGSTDDREFAFSLAASLSVDIHIVNITHVILRFVSFTMPTVDSELPISQTVDRAYLNP